MKVLTIAIVLVSVSITARKLSHMDCAIYVQEKIGGDKPSKVLRKSAVVAIDYSKDKNVLVSSYKGKRFAYVVYAEKYSNIHKDKTGLIFSFKDTKEGISIWSPQSKNKMGDYTISLNERGKKEPIYYLKCKTK